MENFFLFTMAAIVFKSAFDFSIGAFLHTFCGLMDK